MKAIILAAGQGTRLKKYTTNLPKGMLAFMGKTLIERQIETFREVGINDIIIVKGFAEEKIKYENVKYYFNEEYATTNMLFSLLKAKEEFVDDIVVSYADIVFEKKMLLKLLSNGYETSFIVDDSWKSYWMMRYGRIDYDNESLIINSENEIISIGSENPKINEIDSRFVGLLKFSSISLEKIVEIFDKDYKEYIDKPWKTSGQSICNAYLTDLIQALVEEGHKVVAERYNHGWIEFDTDHDYEKALNWVVKDKLKGLIELN